MKQIAQHVELTEATLNELNNEKKKLIEKASEAANFAHAPYSKFKVGAAVLLEGGEIITGNNQENVAFPSGLCAERVAVFAAASNFSNKKILKLAIVAINSYSETPVTPCGSCRQVIAEYEMIQKFPVEILLKSKSEMVWISEGISNLLPFQFELK